MSEFSRFLLNAVLCRTWIFRLIYSLGEGDSITVSTICLFTSMYNDLIKKIIFFILLRIKWIFHISPFILGPLYSNKNVHHETITAIGVLIKTIQMTNTMWTIRVQLNTHGLILKIPDNNLFCGDSSVNHCSQLFHGRHRRHGIKLAIDYFNMRNFDAVNQLFSV